MSPEAILRKARALIEREDARTFGGWARDSEGRFCFANSRHAVKWCAAGAIACAMEVEYPAKRVGSMFDGLLEPAPMTDFEKPTLLGALARYNDSHLHAEVLELFDRAIVAASADGA